MTTTVLASALAAVAAGCAAAMLVRPVPRWTAPSGVGAARAGWLLGCLATGAVIVGVAGRFLVPALLVAGAVGGALVLRRRRVGVSAARSRQAEVRTACDLVVAELRAGATPGIALTRAAESCPLLAPAAEAARLGGEVPTVLRQLARVPGAADLRLLGAAWQLTDRAGPGLGEAVAQVALALRRSAATRRVVHSELASARATARLVAFLPLPALAMGSGAGGDPWRFLLETLPGWCCLGGGLALGLLGLAWIEAIVAGAE